MEDNMAEEKVTKDNSKELEKQIEKLNEDLKKAYDIANSYIKAYRNLLAQLNITVQTQADIEAGLNEKLK